MEEGLRLWDLLWRGRAAHGIVPVGIGVYATTGRLEKGYRAHGNELELDFDLVEAGMARPRVKDADSSGGRVPRAARPSRRPRSLCTLTVDEHDSSSGVKRSMLGREPILTPRRRAARRREGSPLVRHERRRRAVGREAPADVVPAARARGRGHAAGRRVLRRALPGDRRGRRLPTALRPRQRAHPGLSDGGDPRLRQARAGDRWPDHPDRRRAGDRHEVPRASRSARTRSARSRRRCGSSRRTAGRRRS